MKHLRVGRLAHCPRERGARWEVLKDVVVSVDRATGIIKALTSAEAFTAHKEGDELVDLDSVQPPSSSSSRFLIPGFVDTHIHAPQYSYVGTGLDKPLLKWLDHYTFPAEERFRDAEVARRNYNAVVSRSLREGTTTAMYFATIHSEASHVLADTMRELGQRGFVGPVSMDINPGVPEYGQRTDAALEDAERFVEATLKADDDLVLPVLTPRYLPTCSIELLNGLGDIAKRYAVHIQSHIAESLDVMEHVEATYPGRRDLEIFKEAGLLTPKTMLAHGVHLNDEELDTMQAQGSGIAHCPLSNFYFANGNLDVRKVLRSGVGVGLGSDVAGGYSISMLSAMRAAIVASRAVLNAKGVQPDIKENVPVSAETAFWMATQGAAEALQLGDEIGSLEVGKKFDALLIELEGAGNIDRFSDVGREATDEENLERLVNLGDGRNILQVWVGGVCRKQNEAITTTEMHRYEVL